MAIRSNVAGVPARSWEARHPGTVEWFTFDWWSEEGDASGRLGGFVSVSFQPRTVWYWAGLTGDGRPFVLVKELDVAPPRRPASLEIRAEGLWADHNCETAFEHWSFGLEAFGVALSDPTEALRSERGDRVALGLDLELDGLAPAVGAERDYAQAGAVHGQVLVGRGAEVETIPVDGSGRRRHRWGGPAGVEGLDWLASQVGDEPQAPAGRTSLPAPVLVADASGGRRAVAYALGEDGWTTTVALPA